MPQPVIAFLGTGLMGAPMARRLLGAGFQLRAWNRNRAKAEALAANGAAICASPAEAAQGANFIVTMLSDGPAVADVLFSGGVLEAAEPGSTVIDMSSVRPSEAREHAERLTVRGIHHLDGPVSGGTRGAQAGTLAIMAGGGETVFETAANIFAPMGRAVRVGPSGSGQLAKLANQAIVAITIGAVAEATLLVAESGADLTAFRAALNGGFADSAILQQHGRRMQEGDFAPGGKCAAQLKDLDNVLAEARVLGIRLPLVESVRDRFARLSDAPGGGDLDHSALYLDLLDLNGRNA